MAIAVETVAITAMDGGATVAKPTGLAVGDLLLAIVADDQYNFNALDDPAGWTNVFRSSSGSNNYGEVLCSYIVATSTEVAASNFTFPNAAGGMLYRISGGVPSLLSTGVGTVYGDQSLVILIGLAADNGGRTTNFSGYSVTGGASVTFTERFDDSTSSGLSVSLGIADGLYNSSEEITAFSITQDDIDDNASFLIKIPAIQNATGSNALLQTDPLFFAGTASAGTTGSNALLEVSPEFPSPSGKATQQIWTNEASVETTWTNESL